MVLPMSSDPVSPPLVQAQGVGKSFIINTPPTQRLWSLLGISRKQHPRYQALHNIDLTLHRGESLGIIGQNGAGKSTLLQLLCGTLHPDEGHLKVNGRIAALLELGAGFNPEFTGRENILFNAATLGMQPHEIAQRTDEIIQFADIGPFIDQPVRTYSSGMYVRLAFSVATAVHPDLLVIDEALAVGDASFARKSFDRIMALKEQGVGLVFCSHSLFQVEALCERAIWVHKGCVMAHGKSADVIASYNDWLATQSSQTAQLPVPAATDATTTPAAAASARSTARFIRLAAHCGNQSGPLLQLNSGQDDLTVQIEFQSDPHLPPPNLALMVFGPDTRPISSTGTWIDGVQPTRDAHGRGTATLTIPRFPFLKGRYTLGAYLMCEKGLHVYEGAEHFATLQVTQSHLEQGIVSVPHHWQVH